MSGAWLRQIVLVLFALVIDDKLAPGLAVLGVRPDFVLPAVLFTTLRFGPAAGAWVGFACGLFVDVATPEHLGARALALAVAAFVSGRIARQVDVGSLPVQLILLLIMGTLDAAIHQTASNFTAPATGFAQFFTRGLGSVLYTTLIVAPLLLVMGRRLVPLRASWRESA